MNAELHLFIIWQRAGHELEACLELLDDDLELLDTVQVTWSEARFSENLTRFYGENLPRGSFKERECGRGPFHVAIVRDPSPTYGEREATAGVAVVNTHCFDAKARCRHLTGGGFLIHGTNTVAEADHDCALLFGTSIADHAAAHPGPWDGVVRTLARDLSGAGGFENLPALFRVLDAACTYVVLRNFEGLPESASLPGHEDIDLLTDDGTLLAHITGARPARPEPYRVLHTIRVGGDDLLFDFRVVGDGYYDEALERDILGRRVLDPAGFFKPSDDDHYGSLLYHATVHKVLVSEQYAARLSHLSGTVGAPLEGTTPELLRAALHAWLGARGYGVTEARDLSVVYNRFYAKSDNLSPERARHEARLQGALYVEAMEGADDRSIDGDSFRTAEVTGHAGARQMLSWRRHLPLRALPLGPDLRAVELGAGCGAVTRYLGERCASVLAVESNPGLAAAARLRCSDLMHVSVTSTLPPATGEAGLAVALVSDEDRDGALLDDEALSWLARSLGPDGLLVLGVPHTRAIVDLDGHEHGDDSPLEHPDAHDREGLERRLDGLGLSHVLWITPYPDHLLPSVFFTDEAASRSSRALGGWAGRERHPRHMTKAGGLVSDLKIYGDLGEAGALGQRANGLIAVAARTAEALPVLDWQVLAFNGERRRAATQTRTRVAAGAENLIVEKTGSDHAGAWFAFHPTSQTPLHEGTLLEAALVEAVAAGDREGFFALTREHAKDVETRFAVPDTAALPHKTGPGDAHLDGRALDAVYGNFVRTPSGLEVFDLEWSTTTLIPLSFILFRSLLQLNDVIAPGELATRLDLAGLGPAGTYEQMMLLLLSEIGPETGLQMGHLKLFQDVEIALQRFAREGEREDAAPPALLLHQGLVTAKVRRDMAMAAQVKGAMARFYAS